MLADRELESKWHARTLVSPGGSASTPVPRAEASGQGAHHNVNKGCARACSAEGKQRQKEVELEAVSRLWPVQTLVLCVLLCP